MPRTSSESPRDSPFAGRARRAARRKGCIGTGPGRGVTIRPPGPMEINKDILRWVLLIGAMPIWIPFLFTLWRDFNDALREDGGLLGSPPTGRELEQVRQELAG